MPRVFRKGSAARRGSLQHGVSPHWGRGAGGLRPLQKAMLQLKPWRYLQVSHWEDGEENTRLREDVQRPLDGKEELKEIWNG